MITKERKEKIDYILSDLLSVPEKGAHQITIKMIRLMEQIVGHIYETSGRFPKGVLSKDSLFKMAEGEFSTLFPSLPSYKIPDPLLITKPPQGYISLRDFNKLHPGMISSSQSHSYLRSEFQDSWIHNKRQWFLDEIKYLKFLLTKDLYRDRILARREKYQHVLTEKT